MLTTGVSSSSEPALRRFLHWSEEQAVAVGLTPAQHQLLLAIRGQAGPERADDRRRGRGAPAPSPQRGRAHRPGRSRRLGPPPTRPHRPAGCPAEPDRARQPPAPPVDRAPPRGARSSPTATQRHVARNPLIRFRFRSSGQDRASFRKRGPMIRPCLPVARGLLSEFVIARLRSPDVPSGCLRYGDPVIP